MTRTIPQENILQPSKSQEMFRYPRGKTSVGFTYWFPPWQACRRYFKKDRREPRCSKGPNSKFEKMMPSRWEEKDGVRLLTRSEKGDGLKTTKKEGAGGGGEVLTIREKTKTPRRGQRVRRLPTLDPQAPGLGPSTIVPPARKRRQRREGK